MLHNEHVYKYYRFKGWVAEQRKRWMRRDFMYQWAQDERDAMYAELKKQTMRRRGMAIELSMPPAFIKLADYYIDKSIYLRNLPETKASAKCKNYDRAKTLLLNAQDVFDAHLNNRFSKYKMPFLGKEVSL